MVPINTDDAVSWLSTNWIGIFILALAVFVVWRWARPFIHRLVMRTLIAQERAMPTGAPEDELAKRAATLEDLANRLVRLLLVLGIVLVAFGVLDLWPAVAGMGIFLAALTLAGQSVVLDYIMGVLILMEGQYFLGDTLRVGTIEGVVEEVGLRRTVVRDAAGIVHSISNGTIRVASNLTRIYAVAIVDIQGVRNEDVETVIALMDRIGAGDGRRPGMGRRLPRAPRVQRHGRVHGPGPDHAHVVEGPTPRSGHGPGRAAAPGGGRRSRLPASTWLDAPTRPTRARCRPTWAVSGRARDVESAPAREAAPEPTGRAHPGVIDPGVSGARRRR